MLSVLHCVKQQHRFSERKPFIRYICAHSSEVWQRRRIHEPSARFLCYSKQTDPQQKERNGSMFYICWPAARCNFLASAKQRWEIWENSSVRLAGSVTCSTSALISSSLQSLLGEDFLTLIFCCIKRNSRSFWKDGVCICHVINPDGRFFPLVFFRDLFLKFGVLLVTGNEILIHVPLLCK